ncbi:MAG: sensor histidine kinase [Vicinamibacterales bacterium]
MSGTPSLVLVVAAKDGAHDRFGSHLERHAPEAVLTVLADQAALPAALKTAVPSLVVVPLAPTTGSWRGWVTATRAAAPLAVIAVLVSGADPVSPGALLESGADDWLSLDERPEGRVAMLLARGTARAGTSCARSLLHWGGKVLSACRVGIWQFDPASATFTTGPSLARMLGYPDGDLPDDDAFWARVMPAGDARTLRAQIDEVIAGARQEVLLEHRGFKADGQLVWLASRGRAVRDTGGPAPRVLGVSLDVTELVETRQALAEAEARNRFIVETAAEVIVLYTSDYRVEWANPSAERILGYPPGGLVGLSAMDLMDPAEHPRVPAIQRRRLLGDSAREIYRIRHRDGGTVWLEASGVAIRDDEGTVQRHLVVASDVSGKVNREQELSLALENREALLREVHHRVRNNFQIVLSLLNLQFQALDDPAVQAGVVDATLRIETMAGLHALLYQSHDIAWARADTYLTRIIEALRGAYAERAGRIEVRLDIAPIGFKADDGMRVGLIVNELVSNAFKHAFPGGRRGRVTVTLAVDGTGPADVVRLEVADDGVGLRGASAKRAGALGLDLVQDMVRQLSGTLQVEDAAGVRVTMRFPTGGVLV